MEEKAKFLETLLEKATEFSTTSIELIKLKALDKSTDIVSSFVPTTLVIILVSSFFLFLSLGLALWLGDLLGKTFYGFFLVAGFYILLGIVIHFFLHKPIKRVVGDFFIKHMLK
jgi:uncharacterized membrane protein